MNDNTWTRIEGSDGTHAIYRESYSEVNAPRYPSDLPMCLTVRYSGTRLGDTVVSTDHPVVGTLEVYGLSDDDNLEYAARELLDLSGYSEFAN